MKAVISRKVPLETRTTDQIFDFRSAARLIGSNCSRSWPFVTLRRRPPIELNSPQSFFGHAARPPETAGLTSPKGEHGGGGHPRMRLNIFKDESTANLAQGGTLAQDRARARLPPPLSVPPAYPPPT